MSETKKRVPRTGVISKVRQWVDQHQAENPRTHVAAKRAAGAVLIADALVGLENPFDGESTRPGLWGRLKAVIPTALILGIMIFVAVGANATMTNDQATEPVTATVVEVISDVVLADPEVEGGVDSEVCELVYSFTAGESGNYIQTAAPYTSEAHCGYEVGEKIEVLYNPEVPTETMIAGDGAGLMVKITIAVAIVFGLIFLFNLIGIAIDIAQIVIGSMLIRSAAKDAKEIPGGVDLASTVDEMKDQLVPMVMQVKSGMRGASRMFKKSKTESTQ